MAWLRKWRMGRQRVCADVFDDRWCSLRAGHRGDHTDGQIAWYDE